MWIIVHVPSPEPTDQSTATLRSDRSPLTGFKGLWLIGNSFKEAKRANAISHHYVCVHVCVWKTEDAKLFLHTTA